MIPHFVAPTGFCCYLCFFYFPLLVFLRFFGKLESWKAALAGDGLLHMVNQKTGQNLYHQHQKKKA